MVKLPDSTIIPSVRLNPSRPYGRIDSSALAKGEEDIGRAVSSDPTGRAIASGGSAIGRAIETDPTGRAIDTAGEKYGAAITAGETAKGRAITQGGEAMAAAERSGGAAIGQGLERLGKGITDAGTGLAEFQYANDRLDYARAQSELRTKKIQLDQEFANDTEYATQQERYSKKLTDIRETTSSMVGNSRLREQFNLETEPTVAAGIASTSQRAFSGLRTQKTNDALMQLDELKNAALRTDDPAERAGLVKSGNDLIASLQSGGFIDPTKAQELRVKWTQDYAKSSVAILPDEEQINKLREAPTDREATLDRIGGAENSTGDPKAKNKNSTATGDFQFIESTWLDTLKAHRPDIAKGRDDKTLLALRGDSKLSREMAGYLMDDNGKALRAAGVVPTPTTLYLAHFLGSQGAIDVMKADKGTPVADVLDENAITSNRSVLAGKTTDAVIAWANQKMGGTSRGRGDAIDFIPEVDRVNLLNSATARYLTKQRQTDSETAIAIDDVKGRINGDVQKMLSFGIGDDNLTPDVVRSVAGSKGVQQWQDAREDAHKIWLNTHDLSSLTETQIAQRLAAVAPKAEDKDFGRRQTIFKAVKEQADALGEQRRVDPAASVADDPVVKQASQGVNEKDPSTFAPVIKARMVAQERAGIPPEARSPITKNEALAMTAPLRQMLPGQEKQVLMDLGKSFKEKFGDTADQAFAYALRAHKVDADTAEAATKVIRKLQLGQPLDAVASRQGDQKSEIAAAEKAVTANVPAMAIRDLRADPSLAPQFDAKFGKGTSKKILENYPIR